MKLMSVNIPKTYIKAIEDIVAAGGLYPSRSELIRVALRDYLKKILNEEPTILATVKDLKPQPIEIEDDPTKVCVGGYVYNVRPTGG